MRVLITGGAQGLGLACVRKALSQGADVIVLDTDAVGLAKLPAQAMPLRADLADRDDVEVAIGKLSQEKAFDLVIMNAGINETGPFEQLPLDRLQRVVAVNLTASMQLTAGLIAAGKLAPSGRLVFMSSLSHYVGYPGASVYAATKDGITIFAKSLRRTLRKRLGVLVQVVSPGPMDTEHATRHSPTRDTEGARIAPEIVADLIWRSERGFMIVPGRNARIAAILGRLFPGFAGQVMRRLIFEKLAAEPPTSKETAG